jgi:hypothetical protein
VRDSGIGIAPGMLPHVFDTFSQADRSLERARGGLGLGLALVRGLVELHGGEVRAASPGPGAGAEFTVSLPIGAVRTTSDDRPATGTGRERPAVRSPRPTARVLVVDDNRDAAEMLRDLLEIAGCAVDVAHSGPAGVAAAARFRPEVVLCDIGLPGMDGFAVAAALRGDPATAAARLVAITG